MCYKTLFHNGWFLSGRSQHLMKPTNQSYFPFRKRLTIFVSSSVFIFSTIKNDIPSLAAYLCRKLQSKAMAHQ